MQESFEAAGIHVGSAASSASLIGAIKHSCRVEPQIACHYGTADLQEVSRLVITHLSDRRTTSVAMYAQLETSLSGGQQPAVGCWHDISKKMILWCSGSCMIANIEHYSH